MIESKINELSNWIVYVAFPEIQQFLDKFFENNIFVRYSDQELQVYFVKIAIQAIILAVVCGFTVRATKKNNQKRKKKRPTYRKEEKKWSPTGWVWNEKEGLWEPPDYIIAESNERWRYDKAKGIWIDLNKEE